MFNWFVNLFRKDDVDYYKPKERLLYKYWDGKKKVQADPMILYRRLMEKGTDLTCDMQVAYSMSKDRFKARVAMIDKIQWIFSIKSLEEGGLTETHCEGLLNHFISWCDSLKKNLNPSPTSQTAASPPSNLSLEENQPTENFLGFGSIEQEINKEKPILLPSDGE